MMNGYHGKRPLTALLATLRRFIRPFVKDTLVFLRAPGLEGRNLH